MVKFEILNKEVRTDYQGAVFEIPMKIILEKGDYIGEKNDLFGLYSELDDIENGFGRGLRLDEGIIWISFKPEEVLHLKEIVEGVKETLKIAIKKISEIEAKIQENTLKEKQKKESIKKQISEMDFN